MKLSKITKALVILVNLFVWLSGISASQAAKLDPRMGTATIVPSLTKPSITSVVLIGSSGSAINTPTLTVSIKINYTGGAPTAYRVSETSTGLSRASWKSYSSFPLPKYTFRYASEGTKYLFVQLMNKAGISSAVRDGITYQLPPLEIKNVSSSTSLIALNKNNLTVRFSGIPAGGRIRLVKLEKYPEGALQYPESCFYTNTNNGNLGITVTANSAGEATVSNIPGWFNSRRWDNGKNAGAALNSNYSCQFVVDVQTAQPGSSAFGATKRLNLPVQVQGLTRYRVTSTNNFQYLHGYSATGLGACEGTAHGVGSPTYNVGKQAYNGDVSYHIRGGLVGTNCSLGFDGIKLPAGFFWGGPVLTKVHYGRNCKVAQNYDDYYEVVQPTSFTTVLAGQQPCDSRQTLLTTGGTGSSADTRKITLDSTGPRSEYPLICISVSCKKGTSTNDGVRAVIDSVTVFGPPGAVFP